MDRCVFQLEPNGTEYSLRDSIWSQLARTESTNQTARLFTVANFGSHTAFLATNLSTSFTGSFRSHSSGSFPNSSVTKYENRQSYSRSANRANLDSTDPRVFQRLKRPDSAVSVSRMASQPAVYHRDFRLRGPLFFELPLLFPESNGLESREALSFLLRPPSLFPD